MAVTFGSATTARFNGGGTAPQSFAANPSIGAKILVGVWAATVTIPVTSLTMSDNAAVPNTYTLIHSYEAAADNYSNYLFSAPVTSLPSSGALSPALTIGAPFDVTNAEFVAAWYTGLGALDAVGDTVSGTGATSLAVSVVAHAGGLVFNILSDPTGSATSTFSISVGTVRSSAVNDTTDDAGSVADDGSGGGLTAGTKTYTWTASPAGRLRAIAAAFFPSSVTFAIAASGSSTSAGSGALISTQRIAASGAATSAGSGAISLLGTPQTYPIAASGSASSAGSGLLTILAAPPPPPAGLSLNTLQPESVTYGTEITLMASGPAGAFLTVGEIYELAFEISDNPYRLSVLGSRLFNYVKGPTKISGSLKSYWINGPLHSMVLASATVSPTGSSSTIYHSPIGNVTYQIRCAAPTFAYNFTFVNVSFEKDALALAPNKFVEDAISWQAQDLIWGSA